MEACHQAIMEDYGVQFESNLGLASCLFWKSSPSSMPMQYSGWIGTPSGGMYLGVGGVKPCATVRRGWG